MSFEEWLDKQPFGGPSRTPGKRLLTDSTVNLMRKAWDAGQKERDDFYSGQDVVNEQRMRGDIRE